MHPLNKLRLQAGLTIDPSLERRTVTEAREVPRKRADLKPKNVDTVYAHVVGVTKALAHLKNAVKALERIPAHDFMGDIPAIIAEIETIISSDGGESGMEQLLNLYQQELDRMRGAVKESQELSEDHFKKGEMITDEKGYQWVVKGYEGEGDNEVYKLECPISGKTEEKKYSDKWKKTTAAEKKDLKKELKEEDFAAPERRVVDDFKTGEKVLYDNGIWLVHVADAKADLVGIIPPSMKDASKEEKAKAMQQVKRDKLRKPSEEECEVMAGPDGVIGTHDDIRLESTLNYTQSNAESFEDNEEDPANVVGQAKGQWANSLNPKVVKNEYTTQLDNRGDASSDEYDEKVKVPAKVKTALKDAIAAFTKDAEKQGGGHTANETKQFYLDTAAAFGKIQDMLNGGSIMDIKKAQVFASSLMGPMLHKLPDVVWDFLVNGGQKRSLKDYMNPVKKVPTSGIGTK